MAKIVKHHTLAQKKKCTTKSPASYHIKVTKGTNETNIIQYTNIP